MWLDAFKPKTGNHLNIGVTSVPGVTSAANPATMRVRKGIGDVTPPYIGSVTSVTHNKGTQGCDTGDTLRHVNLKQCHIGKNGVDPSNHAGLQAIVTPVTPETPEIRYVPEVEAKVLRQLAQFRIDDCLDDPELHLIDRINNMAYCFMETDGMAFESAIALAAEITVHCSVAHCEASYVNVRELWLRLTAVPNNQKEQS